MWQLSEKPTYFTFLLHHTRDRPPTKRNYKNDDQRLIVRFGISGTLDTIASFRYEELGNFLLVK